MVDHGSQLSLHIQPSPAINQENQDRTKKTTRKTKKTQDKTGKTKKKTRTKSVTFQFCWYFTFGYISVLAKFQSWCLVKLCFFVKVIILTKLAFCQNLHFAKIGVLTKVAFAQIWRFPKLVFCKNLYVAKVFTLQFFLLCQHLHFAQS